MKYVKINYVTPAPYNPRSITPEKVEKLQHSIKYVGFGKPVILTGDGTIIAGHQRVNAAKNISITEIPVFQLPTVTKYEEIRFNQIHNSSDTDFEGGEVWVAPSEAEGFREVQPEDIHIKGVARGAQMRSEISKLFLKFGPFSSAIATQSGEVLSGLNYAVAMKQHKAPLLVFYIPDEKRDQAMGYLREEYGEFNYGNLPKNTYIQTFAQKFRLRKGSHDKSTLYETVVKPTLRKDQRALDFGCGQADYVLVLKKLGYDIDGLEFYYRKGNGIDIATVHGMIKYTLRRVSERRYDAVICDSVLNSVDSLQAEHDVLNVCNAFGEIGSKLYISGRQVEFINSLARHKKTRTITHRNVEFLDKHGFSALFRKGEWFYQKFHSKADAIQLVERYGYKVDRLQDNHSAWAIEATKIADMPKADVLASIRREYELPLPGGQTIGCGDLAVKTFERIL